jgi:hypothetical protein
MERFAERETDQAEAGGIEQGVRQVATFCAPR